MKTRNIFKVAAIMALVLFASCSKEEINDSQDNGLVTLTVPAIQEFGDENAQSRTVFEFDGGDATPPKVKWEVEDIIYIGYINPNEAEGPKGKSLTYLKNEGLITEFKCISVDEATNFATFEGSSIVENANIAIYTKKPEKVTVYYKSADQYGVQCNINNISISSDNSHLAGNDLLVSVFDTTDKKLNFKRVFGLVKFELTLPEEVTGTGTLICNELKQTGTANINKTTGEFLPNSTSNTDLTINNISVEGNNVSFYSFVPTIKVRKNDNPTTSPFTYTFKINDKTYSKTVSYTKDALIEAHRATKIAVDFTDQPAQ